MSMKIRLNSMQYITMKIQNGCHLAIFGRFSPKIQRVLLIRVTHNSTDFHENYVKTVCLILITDRRTTAGHAGDYITSLTTVTLCLPHCGPGGYGVTVMGTGCGWGEPSSVQAGHIPIKHSQPALLLSLSPISPPLGCHSCLNTQDRSVLFQLTNAFTVDCISQPAAMTKTNAPAITPPTINPLQLSGVRWLHSEVFCAIQV